MKTGEAPARRIGKGAAGNSRALFLSGRRSAHQAVIQQIQGSSSTGNVSTGCDTVPIKPGQLHYGIYVSHGEGQPFVHVVTVHDTVADLILTPDADVRIR